MKRLRLLFLLLCISYAVSAQESTQNYICTRMMLNEKGNSYIDNISYFDGLGRPFQTVQKSVENGLKTGSNLATLQEYDNAGREWNTWLPIVASGDYVAPATFKSSAPANYSSDSRPYNQAIYEASPLNRIAKQYGPGAAWYNTHPIDTEYMTNTTTSPLNCINYSVSATGVLTNNGNYPSVQLYVAKTSDEDKNISYIFTDKLDRTILSRQMQGSEAHDTYYVYDDFGNLRFVLQPMYQSSANLDQYAFQYKYDGFNRCIWKKLPGSQYSEYVYDSGNRLIFSQDTIQRSMGGKWTYYLYDNIGRLTQQGECTGKNASTNRVVHIQNFYDKYTAFYTSTGNNSNFPNDTSGNSQGYLTGSIVTVLGSSNKIYKAFYYDIKGRMIKSVQNNLLSGYDINTTVYTFSDKPATVMHNHTASGKTARTEVYTYSYDHLNRISKVQHTLGTTKVTLYDATYDNFGRLFSKSMHGSATNKLTYTYNLRSWLTGISGTKFTQNLYYNTGIGTAKYNGSISSMTWKSGDESTIRGYKFTYDGMDRMLNATYGETASINTNPDRFSENVTLYDKNGNIKTLQRYGQSSASTYGLLDNLTYTLTGNQLNRVDDASTAPVYGVNTSFVNGTSAAGEYTYDANGNLTQDLNKGIAKITYNVLNLPSVVTFSDKSTITYTYTADGTKLRTVHKIGSTTTTTDYCGNVIYENGVQKLLLTEEGYVNLTGTQQYHYYLKDHQGNNRVVINQGGTAEETNHYYPFGGVFANTNVQPYKYNGKELDTKKGLNWYDYGARLYDAALGRFTTVDPLAEKYYNTCSYGYCKNNPVNAFDFQGKLVIFINGFHNGFEGASSAYWRVDDKPVNFTTAVMAHFGDWNDRYYDGSLGGAFGFSYNMQSQNRHDLGYASGLKDVKEIISQLARDANGNISESIKVISHSMGGSYAKGFLQALIEYIEKHPGECNGISISEYDFAPYQPYYQKAIKGVDTYQYSHKKDKYAGFAPINGANQMETIESNDKGHSIGDFYDYIISLPEGRYRYENGKFVAY